MENVDNKHDVDDVNGQLATLETSGSLGRVLFLKGFWDRYRGRYLSGVFCGISLVRVRI